MTLSYGRQWIEDDDIAAVTDVLQSGWLTQGPKVAEFEKNLCDYTGAKFAVAVANGTAALHLAVAALNADWQRGDEGITSAVTFLASANCLVYNGLAPVFADVDAETVNIDIDDLARRISPRTRVIIPVHFAGRPAPVAAIRDLVRGKNMAVIEDAAHAIGSRYPDGGRVGNCALSEMTTFSFHPVKTVTSAEGGAVTTNDRALCERLLLLRNHGMSKDPQRLSRPSPGPWYYEMAEPGFNYRLSDLQAALGVSQLKKIERFRERRRVIVARYNAAFQDLPAVRVPPDDNGESCFHLYVLRVDYERLGMDRAAFVARLAAGDVGTQVHYIPLNLQPYYQKHYGCRAGDCPAAESYYSQALSLPLYPAMSDGDVQHVIETVRREIRFSQISKQPA